MAAGRMNHRLSFQARENISDAYGNTEGEFLEEFVRWTEVRPSLGIETNAQARLAGEQPVDLQVYRDSETLMIDPSWRAVDVNNGTIYTITSPAADLQQNRRYLVMKAVIGRAA